LNYTIPKIPYFRLSGSQIMIFDHFWKQTNPQFICFYLFYILTNRVYQPFKITSGKS